MGAKKSRALRDNPLPWASIDAYPEWIAALLSNYKRVAAASATADDACSCEERARARRALEETLLSTPLRTAPIKYDGTCFGKLDTGELVGRKQTLGAACAESNDPTCGGSDGGTGVTAALPPRRPPPPARIIAVQARMFTPLGTAVTSGSGSGGGAAAQVVFFGVLVVCHFFNSRKLHSGRHCLRHTTANRRETQFRAESAPGRFSQADPRSIF